MSKASDDGVEVEPIAEELETAIEKRIAAFDELSASLSLDDEKVRRWQETVRDARP